MSPYDDDPDIESEYDRAHDELVRSGLDESELEQAMQAAYRAIDAASSNIRCDNGGTHDRS
jgi:hypothetical protein